MRVAREGLNCTLTGTKRAIHDFCNHLRQWQPELFCSTEFKMTHDLPHKQAFGDLKLIPATELVNYGLQDAPRMAQYGGTHLEPRDYHAKLSQPETVVIDVRNHYETNIGRFNPPSATWLDPHMRKSTEFPVWLNDPETQQSLKDKTVLMYCTGGIRCERASALLKYKMETDPAVKDLNIKGVYQLQGGIDKYFKEFPDGGYWKGKNYVFDKRFAHYPPVQQAAALSKEESVSAVAFSQPCDSDSKLSAIDLQPLGKCEACDKAWDMYRGKRRCPTCGVPSLICRDCWKAHEEGIKVIDRSVRCDLCVQQNIQSKHELREKEQHDLQEYEAALLEKGLLSSKGEEWVSEANPDGITRLFLRNMCRKSITDELLIQTLPGATHIVWRMDRKTGEFSGQAWVEMESAEAAALAVAKNGVKVLGRPMYIEYQPADGKDAWPPPSSAVGR
ncbi:hypothetical protein MPSEU_000203800 [Mayamaea pseudoterrestris]|nr:hypothetical protein MPSEU_000203800 [Mayamaea pseudoterrestris]